MNIHAVEEKDAALYNQVINHPLQTWQWGEFRKKTGIKVIRRGLFENEKIVDGFQLTIHKIPHTPWNIGYLPKGNLPTDDVLNELVKIGKENNCIFIQLEPTIEANTKYDMQNAKHSLRPSAHPLFTKYSFELDLTKSEDELLKNMHSKTRYNIRVAQKHNVDVVEDNSDEAFNDYLKLIEATTNRQKFYAHSRQYHQLMWETLKEKKNNQLSAHLLIAKYHGESLVTWIVFIFKDTLYYPYGASSNTHREVMASNLMMWEAIKFGQRLKLKKFDMWGALSSEPDLKDSWYGFHRFKQGYGARHVEFVGSYDLVINPLLYQLYKVINKLRWLYLRIKK